MTYINPAIEHYKKRFPANDLQPIGCSREDLQLLEAHLGSRLPEAHREFLLWMGKDHAGILSDSNWYLRDIESNIAELPTLLKRNSLPLPQDPYVCFVDHNGYVAAWYTLPITSQDPEINLYIQNDTERPEPYVWGKFSDWVLHCLETSSLDTWRYREWRQKNLSTESVS